MATSEREDVAWQTPDGAYRITRIISVSPNCMRTTYRLDGLGADGATYTPVDMQTNDELYDALAVLVPAMGMYAVTVRAVEATLMHATMNATLPVCDQETRDPNSRVTSLCGLPRGHAGMCEV